MSTWRWSAGALAAVALVGLVTLIAAAHADRRTSPPALAWLPTPPARDCGVFRVTAQDPVPRASPGAQRCLVTAFAVGRPARLSVDTVTAEGDVIPVDLLVTGRRVVRVTIDWRGDRFGSLHVTHTLCGTLRLAPHEQQPRYSRCVGA